MEQYPSEMAAPPRKKRGRPKKTEKASLIPQQMDDASGAKSKDRAKKGLVKCFGSGGARKKKQREKYPLSTPLNVSDSDAEVEAVGARREHGSSRPLGVNVGQRVDGVVDGLFDAGYLVTIRVGATDTVFRGVVFGPGLTEPLSVDNDVAPSVLTKAREDVAETCDVSVALPTSAVPHKPQVPNSFWSSPVEDQRGIVTAESAKDPGVQGTFPSPQLPPPVSSANNASAGYSPGPVSYRSSPFSQSLLQNASPGSFSHPPPSNPNGGKEDRPPVPGFPPAYGYD